MKRFSIFFIISWFLMTSSCVCHYNFSGLKADTGIDVLGDGVYIEQVLHDQKAVVHKSLGMLGKSKAEIRDFVGYTMSGGIIYFYIDIRNGLTPQMIAEVNQFQHDWLNGDYVMYDRNTTPVWLVYGEKEEDLMQIAGYYKGKGWHIFELGNIEKRYYDPVNSLEEIDFFEYIPLFVERATINC